MSITSLPMISIEFHREEIPVETMHPEMVPDEKWRFVDANGHGHFWEGEDLPTLEWVVTGAEWYGDEYESWEVEIGEYRCRLCGEVIEPKRLAKYGPKFLPGLATFTVSINGESFILTEEGYAQSVEKWAKILRKEGSRV